MHDLGMLMTFAGGLTGAPWPLSRSDRLSLVRLRAGCGRPLGSLVPLIEAVVAPTATVATDRWPACNQLERDGFRHERHVCKGPRDGVSHPVLNAVHLLISSLKTWLRGRFHGASRTYLPAYVAEFMYR